jgi:hypothetical protein
MKKFQLILLMAIPVILLTGFKKNVDVMKLRLAGQRH